MNKILKNLIFITVILFACGILLFLTLPKVSEFAEASVNSVPSYEYYINGEATDEVTLRRGESAVVTVAADGVLYCPILTPDSEDYALRIEGNLLGVAENSVVGGVLSVYLSIETDEGLLELPEPLTVYPTLEDGFEVAHLMSEDGYTLTGGFASLLARVTMSGQAVDLRMRSGDSIAEVLAGAGKQSYGNVEIETMAVTLTGYDNVGNEREFTVNNGESNLSLQTYSTNSALNGDGTASSPYLISNEAELCLIPNYDSTTTVTYFMQTADMDIDSSNSFSLKTFYGNYNGDGYAMNRTGMVAIGFCRTNRGIIRNLQIIMQLNSSFGYIISGGICVYNYGQILNCEVKNAQWAIITIEAGVPFGGIAGVNMIDAEIRNCTVSLTLQQGGLCQVGGITATNNGDLSYNTVSLLILSSGLGNHVIGGLAVINQETGTMGRCDVNLIVSFTDTSSAYEPLIGGAIGKNHANPLNYVLLALGSVEKPTVLPENTGIVDRFIAKNLYTGT